MNSGWVLHYRVCRLLLDKLPIRGPQTHETELNQLAILSEKRERERGESAGRQDFAPIPVISVY